MAKPSIGVWLIGVRGGVAATTIVGLSALKKGLIEPWGLVSALGEFSHLDLPAWDDLLVGGHEIRPVSLADEAMRLATESRAIDAGLIAQCKAELDRIDRRVRPGHDLERRPDDRRLAGPDIPAPRIARRGDRPVAARPEGIRRGQPAGARDRGERGLDRAAAWTPRRCRPGGPSSSGSLEQPRKCPLPASSLYAIAALDLGYSYINFTPSLGSAPAAIDELARLRGTRHMGCDGKTGETLLKSVLAPMFARRNLRVMSWVGHNIFGNMDGRVLDDPANKQTKVASKDHLIRRDPRLPAADARLDRVHREPRRLEDGLGPRPLPGLPGHADDAAVHLAGLRLAPGRPAGARPGPLHGPGLAPRRHRPAAVSGQFLQEPLRRRRAGFRPAQFQMLEAWAGRVD